MQWKSSKIIGALCFVVLALTVAKPSFAYAPSVSGKVTQNTGAPLNNVWVVWDSDEIGDDGNTANEGDHFRYAGTNERGKYMFKGWDSEGVEKKGGQVYSNVGKKEYEDKINLDYDDSNGKEARRADTNLYDIFNCHNEVNSFFLKLPASMAGAKIKARWRRDSNNTAWSEWKENKVSLPKDEFSNSHDYEIEFAIELPKTASIRDLDTHIETKQIQSINTKVPACLKVDLCTESGAECSNNAKTTPGVHRVILSGVGEIQRKLTIGNESKPIWIVECVQRGSADNPQYMCTTGNSQMDTEVFKKDNFSTLKNELGYSSKVFFSDGITQTSPKITDVNRQDVYEWETKINQGKKLVSVFMAMYDPTNTRPAQSGDQPSQIQATLSNEEGCRLIIDPYGRVYDSYTFEPLSNASVTLSKKTTTGTYAKVVQGDVIGNLTNPYTTGIDGKYSFIVPPGTYRLDTAKEGYTKGNSGDIIQKDKPLQVNMGLEPLDKQKALAAMKKNPIKIETYFQKLNKSTNSIRIEGTVSHPFAVISVYSQKLQSGIYKRSLKVVGTQADANGTFVVTVPLTKLGKGEIVGELEAAKKNKPDIKTNITLEPLQNGVEGFAITSHGTVADAAQVELYLPFSDVPVAQTTANSQGYFTFTSQEVPEVPYTIHIKNSAGEGSFTPRSFLAMNAALGSSNNVYAQAHTANENVLGESNYSITTPSYENENNKISTETPSGLMIMVAVILLLFIFTAAALLSVYIKQHSPHKRKQF